MLHGRRAFVGAGRNLVGCYMNWDEFTDCARRVGVLPSMRGVLPIAAPRQ